MARARSFDYDFLVEDENAEWNGWERKREFLVMLPWLLLENKACDIFLFYCYSLVSILGFDLCCQSWRQI